MAKGYRAIEGKYKPINTFQQKRKIIACRKSMLKNILIESFLKTE